MIAAGRFRLLVLRLGSGRMFDALCQEVDVNGTDLSGIYRHHIVCPNDREQAIPKKLVQEDVIYKELQTSGSG